MTRGLIALLSIGTVLGEQTTDAKPVRLAIAGLVHGHVSGFLTSAKVRKDVEIVGVFDPDAGLTASYAKANGLDPDILFQDLGAMLDRVRPEAVATFTATSDHADRKSTRLNSSHLGISYA